MLQFWRTTIELFSTPDLARSGNSFCGTMLTNPHISICSLVRDQRLKYKKWTFIFLILQREGLWKSRDLLTHLTVLYNNRTSGFITHLYFCADVHICIKKHLFKWGCFFFTFTINPKQLGYNKQIIICWNKSLKVACHSESLFRKMLNTSKKEQTFFSQYIIIAMNHIHLSSINLSYIFH